METIKNILTAILKWLGSIPSDKLLHLIAGAVIAAFFALVIPYTARPEQKRAVRQWRKESVCRNRYPLRDIRHHAESPIPEV